MSVDKNKTRMVTGGTGFLGSHFIYRLVLSGTPVVALVRGKSTAVSRERLFASIANAAASYCEPFERERFESLIHVIAGNLVEPLCGVADAELAGLRGRIDEVWHIAANLQFEERHREAVFAQNTGGTRHALDLCAALGAPRFSHVSTAYVAGRRRGPIAEAPVAPGSRFNNVYEESKAAAEKLVEDGCRAANIDYRIVRPSIIVGPAATKSSGGSDTGFYGFVREIYKARALLRREGLELRAPADPSTGINLVPVDSVVADMLQLTSEGFGEQRYFHLVNPTAPSARELFEVAVNVIEINPVRLEPDYVPTTPMERMLAKRLDFYASYFQDPKVFQRSLEPVVTIDLEDVELYLRRALLEMDGSPIEQVLTRNTFRARDGLSLTSLAGGRAGAPAVVLVNAYGMPADFFTRVATRLASNYRVLTWETRGAPNLSGDVTRRSVAPDAHCEDLRQLLDAHGVRGPAHVVGWCSGVHIAHRFARLHPERVASLTLLNGGFTAEGLPLTVFQQNMLDTMPRIARGLDVARFYHTVAYGGARDPDGRASQLNHLLDGIDPSLIPMTSLPFQTPESLHRYALMLSELFVNGEEPWAGQARCPCLVLGGVQDQVAHFDGSRAFAELCGADQFVIMEDGDHYSLFFDDALAEAVESFLVWSEMSDRAAAETEELHP